MSNEAQITSPGSRARWPFRSRKVVLVPLLLLGALAVAIWRRSLVPDVREPFDVREFVTFSIPDDQNAFKIYRKAGQLLVFEPMKEDPSRGQIASANYDEVIAKGFQAANEDCRKWLAANRAALDLWRHAGRVRDHRRDDVPSGPRDYGRLDHAAQPRRTQVTSETICAASPPEMMRSAKQ
jgi:hypothetical protein